MKNKFLTPNLATELFEALSGLTVAECYGIYLQIYPQGQHLLWNTILDNHASDSLAKDCGPIVFYGGPMQKTHGGTKFRQIKGSVLAYLIDFVLFELATSEDNILEELDVPTHV